MQEWQWKPCLDMSHTLCLCIHRHHHWHYHYHRANVVLTHKFTHTHSWDEWVPESRILKHTEANLERQQELIRAQNKQKEEARLAALPQQLASMAGGKGAARAKGGAAMDGADDEDAATTTTTGGRKRTREMTTDKVWSATAWKEFCRAHWSLMHDITRDIPTRPCHSF